MAATFEGAASDPTTTTSDATMVVTAPAGTGGRLYAIGLCVDARTISPPSGWTEVFNDSDGTRRTYLWMRADDAASDYTFTASGTFNGAMSAVIRVSGASTNTPTYAHDTGPNDTSQTAPTIVTPTDNCLVFWCCLHFTNTNSTASKGTERIDNGNGTSGCWMGVYSNLEATAGSITGATITTGGFGAKRLLSFAIESSGGAAATPHNVFGLAINGPLRRVVL